MWVALTPLAYLLGTFPSASLVASASGVDITAIGSGNPGASNVTRALGWRKGALVFGLDALKGLLATLAGLWLGGRPGGYVFGAAAILGHIYPVTRGFRGGKGVATGGGVLAALHPIVFAVITAVWLVLSRVTHKAAIASIAAARRRPGRADHRRLAGVGDRRHGGRVQSPGAATRRQHPPTASTRRALAHAPDARWDGAVRLLEPLALGAREAPNRVMFGPHVTNLGDDDRQLTGRHVAYYRRRAVGGCGTVVIEGASVHPSDWPYERAPLAERCGEGWRAVAAALHEHGTLALASLDHAGGQGSSAYSQRELWAPSRVPEVATREVPKWMEDDDIAAVVAGFASGGPPRRRRRMRRRRGERRPAQPGAPVPLRAHQPPRRPVACGHARSPSRCSPPCGRRSGPVGVLGLRLSCDELAPWAGITPEAALDLAAELTATGVEYLVVTRGSIYSVEQTRPDHHQPSACNRDLVRAVAEATAVPVVAQGSIVDPVDAEWMVADDGGRCAGVEMTRAQIADPDLVAKLRRGEAHRIRPCTRCNQTCQVRDVRNPLVTCIGEPTSGRETEDPDWYAPAAVARRVTVVGAGVAGLEVARVAALRGHGVRVVERADHLGGMAAAAGPNVALVRWLQAEVALDDRVSIELGSAMADVEPAEGDVVVQCTGGRPGDTEYVVGEEVRAGGRYSDVGTLRLGGASLPDAGDVVLIDPIGGPIAVALAEELGPRAILVTPDHIAGNELSRSGDLAPANVRLARAGVRIERRCLVRAVRLADGGELEVEVADRFGEGTRTIAAAAVVDCGFRLPTEPLRAAAASAGDCIAPRTVHEAILDARRVALSL